MKNYLKYWFLDEENPKKYVLDVWIALMTILSIGLIFFQDETGYYNTETAYLDRIVLFFFMAEYAIRFYIATDFRRDVGSRGFFYALGRKLGWMAQTASLLDLLAIIPSLSFFRAFRFLRFLRFLRLFRLVKAVKIFRDIDKLHIILQGMKEHNRLFYILFTLTIFIIGILSLGLYSAEHGLKNGGFSSFAEAFWYSLELIELADTTPKSFFGKLLSAILLLFNMVIFGFFISIILNKISMIMDAFTSGKIKYLNIKNHIVICGFSKSSEKVINDLLADKRNCNKVVLVTQKKVGDKDGLIYVNADFTDFNILKSVKIKEAKFAVVFAEFHEHDSVRDVDLRTVMTIFHIEKEAPHIHTIAEINDEVNAEIIKDKIQGDEILFKETIDAKIITSCIRNPNISPLFYQLFDTGKVRLKSALLSDFKILKPTLVRELKLFFLELDFTLIGVIDHENQSILSPKNDLLLNGDYRLIYLA
jgi:voltage-gated potassium channel